MSSKYVEGLRKQILQMRNQYQKNNGFAAKSSQLKKGKPSDTNLGAKEKNSWTKTAIRQSMRKTLNINEIQTRQKWRRN